MQKVVSTGEIYRAYLFDLRFHRWRWWRRRRWFYHYRLFTHPRTTSMEQNTAESTKETDGYDKNNNWDNLSLLLVTSLFVFPHFVSSFLLDRTLGMKRKRK
jgi:hypothetical protein